MAKLVSNLDGAVANIASFEAALEKQPALADRLGQAHAYYVYEQPDGEPLFGFSKYVGYDRMTPEVYLNQYKQLDGRNTEYALSSWFEEVRPGSTAYKELLAKLSDWLAQYGKRPRGGKAQQVRLMVVRPEYRKVEEKSAQNRKLLDLLIAVADTLPTRQRQELRAAL